MFSYMKRGKPFYKEVFVLALPIILQNLVTTSLGLVDTFMVGVLGEAPLAAVTLANIPIFVIQLVVFGLQSGSSVLISQYWGRGDTDQINRVIGIGCYVAGALSVLFASVMFFFPLELMNLLTNNAELAQIASGYVQIVGISYIFNSITGVYVGAHRSMENPKLGLIIFTISMCTNTFLNWILIFGNLGAPEMGVVGAAVATLASRVVEFIVMGIYALGNRRFRLMPRLLLRPGRQLLGQFVKYSTPVVCNETLWGLGTSLYPTIMGHMDGSAELVAAYAVSGNIEKICTVVIFAVAGTAAIIVGREIGAGRADTVYDVGAALNTLALAGGAVVGGLMLVATHLLFAPYVYPIFKLSPGAMGAATLMLTVVSCMMPLRSFDTTNIVGVLRGGGDVRAAMFIDVSPVWCVGLPVAAIFGLGLGWGIGWVYVGMVMETIARFILGVSRFRSRAWVNDLTRAGG